jgi:hypothetical protein
VGNFNPVIESTDPDHLAYAPVFASINWPQQGARRITDQRGNFRDTKLLDHGMFILSAGQPARHKRNASSCCG